MLLQFKTNRQLKRLTFLFVVLMALLVRIHHINHESLFIDELRQVAYYNYSISDIVEAAAGQQQPPLDYWIGHFISKISYSDFFFRLPAALFGVGSVILLMLVVSRLTAWSYAVGAGVLMALMPFPVYFSQEARPYSIAIFFVLLVLWGLRRFLIYKNVTLLNLFILFVSVLGLLLSRTLSPLVFVVCLLGLLVMGLAVMTKKPELMEVYKTKILLVITVIVVALLFYSPILMKILENGSRYAAQPTQFGMKTLVEGFQRFDLIPLWRAYRAQLEPVSLFIMPLIIGAPFVVFGSEKKKKDLFVWIVLMILPAAALLNLFIFQAKTTYPFRAPYPVYILPLCLIVSTITLQWLFERVKAKGEKLHLTTVSISIFLVAGGLSYTLVDFKTWPKHTDWKGLANYLASAYGRNAILIFDGLVPDGGWEPAFYGFPPYYTGKSSLMPASYIPYKIKTLSSSQYEPVLICFYYRDYYLTRHSPYPIFPGYGELPDFSRVLKNRKLTTRQFTGFIVINLKDASGNGLSDLSSLLSDFLTDMKPDDEVLDMQLALAAIDKKLGKDDWSNYIASVKNTVLKARKHEVLDTIHYIEGNK